MSVYLASIALPVGVGDGSISLRAVWGACCSGTRWTVAAWEECRLAHTVTVAPMVPIGELRARVREVYPTATVIGTRDGTPFAAPLPDETFDRLRRDEIAREKSNWRPSRWDDVRGWVAIEEG